MTSVRSIRRDKLVIDALTPSFDHLVGAGKEGGWNGEAESPGRFQVNDQFKSGRLLDGNVGPFRSLHDAIDEGGGTKPKVAEVHSVGHKRPSTRMSLLANDRNPPTEAQLCDQRGVGN